MLHNLRSSVLWASLAGLFGAVGLAAFYRRMAVGSISVVAPIAAVGAVVPVVFAISAARGHLCAIAMIGILDTAGNTLFAAASSLGEVSVVSVSRRSIP